MSRSSMFIVVFALIAIVLGSPAPGNGNTSPDYSCGGKKGYICPGSNCCSEFGWCGTGKDYCSSGWYVYQTSIVFDDFEAAIAPHIVLMLHSQTKFGTCGSSQPSNTPGSPGKKVSPDGTCGSRKGYTCLGSDDGDCCSEYNYCGSSGAYCGKGWYVVSFNQLCAIEPGSAHTNGTIVSLVSDLVKTQ